VPAEETYGFTVETQKKIVAMMLFDTGAFVSNIDVIKPEFFDKKVLSDMITLMVDFFSKYSRVITEDEFLEEVNVFLGKNKKLPEDEYWDTAIEILELGKKGHFEYIRDKTVDFAKYQSVKQAVLDAGEKRLKHKDYEGIVSQIQKAMDVGKGVKDLGTFIHRDLEKRLELRRTKYDRGKLGIPTGIATIDKELGSSGAPGGICPQEVGIIMSPTKRGKTTVAANFAKKPLKRGFNVVHYSFESNIRSTEEIYDSTITGVRKSKLLQNEMEVRKLYKEFFDREGMGELIIKHFPAGGTAMTIEAHLHQLKAEGIDPALLIVDYLGLMKSADKGMRYEGSTSGRYVMFGNIVLELISLAQRGNYAIWLLHQSKGGMKKKYAKGGSIDTDDAADSQEVVRHVDLVFTLNQTPEEIDMNPQIMRLYAAAGRNVRDGWTVKLQYFKEYAQIIEDQTDA